MRRIVPVILLLLSGCHPAPDVVYIPKDRESVILRRSDDAKASVPVIHDLGTFARVYDAIRAGRESAITAEDRKHIIDAPSGVSATVLIVVDDASIKSMNSVEEARAEIDPTYHVAEDANYQERRPHVKVIRDGPEVNGMGLSERTGYVLPEHIAKMR